ncbi:MAG: prolyl oligopeptidase family serine peptidase [Thermomicrobiales bacterium]
MATPITDPLHDELLWLEDIYGEEPLKWVSEQNLRTSEMLGTPAFQETFDRVLEVLDSTDRIPMVQKYGPWLNNFWKDAEHPRGLWRRTTLDQFRQDKPSWEIMLDLDELCRIESAEWVWAGALVRHPDHSRALLRLSPDGGDAITLREFDLTTNSFVEEGFIIPVAKTLFATWVDADTIYVATEIGPDSLTTSSYPRIVKRLRRGESLQDAETIYEVDAGHMMAGVDRDHTVGFEREILTDVVDFFHRKTSLLRDGAIVEIDAPDDTETGFFHEWLLILTKSDWELDGTAHVAGTLLSSNLEGWLAGDRCVDVLFRPDARSSLSDWSATRNHLTLTILLDVSSRIEVLTQLQTGWTRAALAGAPALHSVHALAVDADESDDIWLSVSGYLTPATLELTTIGSDSVETIKAAPSFFDVAGLIVEQHFTESADGTRVPYFQVGSSQLELDGTNPTLLYGYGGFEISLTPGYNGVVGRTWLENGGVYVVANIRGGGEYGPSWHTSALHANRLRAYEDFSAVARDLVARGVTSPAHLACEGGSNGGLLVGNMLTHYPDLFGAIACEVPLLDMRRYTKLNAGYSWIAEYGDPDDPEQWKYVKTFSPYHNLEAGQDYPPILFYTATSDDRVGPVQARKMAARMEAMTLPDVWFFENREGGHGAAADNKQSAHMRASVFEFLWNRVR